MSKVPQTVDRFPIHFFMVMVRPTQIFQSRTRFKVWQQAFLIIFLTSCMAVPLTLSLARTDHVSMTLIAPKIETALSSTMLNHVRGAVIENGEWSGRTVFQTEQRGVFLAIDPENKIQAAGSMYHRAVPGHSSALVFQRRQFIIAQTNGFGFTVSYPPNRVIRLNGHADQFIHQIEQLWFAQYQPLYRLAISCLGFAALLLVNCFLFFIVTLLLWLTKWTKLSDVRSLRQASSIVILSAAVPTLLASLLSLYQFNFGTMMLLQAAGLSLMMACVFFRTHFQDQQFHMTQTPCPRAR
ncbi:MAG: hypothetical protein ABF868_09645 [Sporolactobacillus sp.]